MFIVVLVALNKSQLENGILPSIQLNTSCLPTSQHNAVLSSVRFRTTAEDAPRCPLAISLGSTHIEEASTLSEGHHKIDGLASPDVEDSGPAVQIAQRPSPDCVSCDCRVDVCAIRFS